MENTIRIGKCTLTRQIVSLTRCKSNAHISQRCDDYYNCMRKHECNHICACKGWAGFTSDGKGYKPRPNSKRKEILMTNEPEIYFTTLIKPERNNNTI